MTDKHMYDNGSQRRILDAIQALAGHELHGLAPKDLAEQLNAGASSVTRDLHNLVSAGFAEQIAETGRYRLGPVLVRIAIAHTTAMERAQQRLTETINRYRSEP
jgi:DNA-binding IclR family transcriptional regulator